MSERAWKNVTAALIAIWVAAMVRLMIADVWDETNGLIAFHSMPLGDLVQTALTRSLGFWRPLPTLVAALTIRATPFEAAWRVLRGLNIGMIIAAVLILARAMEVWLGPSARRTALFTLSVLYSAAAIICAGWYANIFDVTALLVLSAALLLMSRERFVAAGIAIGIAFFCKETAALALPFLLLLIAAGRISLRQSLRTGIPAAALGAVYFVLRSRIVPFGSAGDVHQFLPRDFAPTLVGIADAWWPQTLWGAGPGIGLAIFAASLLAFRSWRARGAFLVFALASAVLYWSMFGTYQNGVLMHYLMFVPRLLLVPVTLTLFAVALEDRRGALALLAVPLLYGAITTYRRYERFQRSYQHIYKMARRAETKPLRVHYPMKPLSDPVRGIEIGEFPDARVILDPASGKLGDAAAQNP